MSFLLMASANSVMKEWIVSALNHFEGRAHYLTVSRWIWENHRQDLFEMGDMFYKWQYNIRWLAIELRKEGRLLPADESPSGTWILVR